MAEEHVVRIVHEMVPTLNEDHESLEISRASSTGEYGWRIRAPTVERVLELDRKLRETLGVRKK